MNVRTLIPEADIANLSTIYGHLPVRERARAAAADGFSTVESWWDFDSATPETADLDAFADSIDDAGVELIALNSHGGDRANGERGLASLPGREEEFDASIDSLLGVARRLGVRLFNVAAGNRDERFSLAQQRATAAKSYRRAGDAVAEIGGTILVEALGESGNPGYPFRTGYDVVEFLDEAGLAPDRVALLFDTYHLASNGIDLVSAWRALVGRIGHLQLADAPGRGEPGSGSIDFPAFLAEVRATEYPGGISLEYLPQQA